jgi:ATP-binding cassette, subfamily B, bacterial MsbA
MVRAGMDTSTGKSPASSKGEFALVLRLLRNYLGPQKLTLAAAILCMAGGAATTAALAWLLDPAIRLLFVEKRVDMLLLIPGAIVLIVFLRAALNYGETVLSALVGRRIIATVQSDMVRNIAILDLGYLNSVHSGQFISKMLYDVTLVRDAAVRGIAGMAKEALSLILLGAVMIYQDWRLSTIAVLTLPIFWVTRNLGRTTQQASRKSMAETGGLTVTLAEMLDGRRVIKAYTLERRAIARTEASIRRRMHYLMRAVKARGASAPAADFFGGLALAAAVLYAGYRGTTGALELNQFAAFVGAMLLAQGPVRMLSNLWTTLKEGLGAAERVFDVIDAKPSIVDAPSAQKLRITRAPFGGSVRFENVAFAYDQGAEALTNFTCDVPAGKKIALVGPSGAGKSTVFNLLLRFYDVTKGRITIDGQDIREVTMESLRGSIALVTQEPFLFDDSVADNIGCGREGASFDDIASAARAAAAHDFVLNLPQGYDTVVGEGGLKLSGGQRQRIAIARAMLRDAPILLLDEATSSLDNENERQIQEALKRLMKGRTTIVIAHRLTTVLDADTIFVLDRGQVVETGTHAELIAKNGLYSRLYQYELQDEVVRAVSTVVPLRFPAPPDAGKEDLRADHPAQEASPPSESRR